MPGRIPRITGSQEGTPEKGFGQTEKLIQTSWTRNSSRGGIKASEGEHGKEEKKANKTKEAKIKKFKILVDPE